jgi:hypothetical protein
VTSEKRARAREAPKRQNGYVARPSGFTDARRETIEATLATGAPLAVAASAAGVSKRTVSRWLENGAVARRRLAAVPDPVEEDELPEEEKIERAVIRTILAAAVQGNDWRAAAWLAERRWPKKYGRR